MTDFRRFIVWTNEDFSFGLKEFFFGTPLHWACLGGQLNIVEYLCTFPDLNLFAEVIFSGDIFSYF
jgi:hypothetical protein